ADRPEQVLPRMILDEGQLGWLHIVDDGQKLLAKAGLDEKTKIGTFLDVRVKRIDGKKIRLFVSFQKSEVEKSGDGEVRVVGQSIQAVKDVELQKAVKMVLQKDAKGSAQRWVEITVEQRAIDDPDPPPPEKEQEKRGKEWTKINARRPFGV